MIYRILAKIERTCARLQGKGWGAATVKKEVDILTKIIKDPKLAIDMGANVGEYTAHLKNKFNDIEIHLFEPSNINNEKLISRFNNDPKVVINNVAVGDKNGHGKLYSNAPGSSLASLTKRKLSGFDSFETVTIIAFENYWKERLGKRNIDILKIDVEGHELDVLNGMGEALSKTKVIQFEFGGCNIDTRS
ncbi:MAG: FkbM family methyltransferase, partial [Mucilaginibacter sp.]|nr:FkbM family methyltransferase [Mucilaginibacter sp.]